MVRTGNAVASCYCTSRDATQCWKCAFGSKYSAHLQLWRDADLSKWWKLFRSLLAIEFESNSNAHVSARLQIADLLRDANLFEVPLLRNTARQKNIIHSPVDLQCAKQRLWAPKLCKAYVMRTRIARSRMNLNSRIRECAPECAAKGPPICT